MKPKVLVAQMIPEEALRFTPEACEIELRAESHPLPKAELISRLKDKVGLVCLLTDTIDDEVLSGAPNLKVVANVAVGYNNIDVAAATRRGVVVTNTPGVLTETTADFAWALLMATARRVVEADQYVRAGKFTSWQFMTLLGEDVNGKTLGVLGFGRIGQAMARRAQGFGMRVLYHSRKQADPATESALRATWVDKATLFKESDFVTVHTPLIPETHHLIGAQEIAAMKRSTILINAARGPIVHEAALVEALSEGRIAGAGLDVFEEEPGIHPGLLTLPNVVLAPHIASASRETRTRMAAMAIENCLAVAQGKTPPNPVNPEALKK